MCCQNNSFICCVYFKASKHTVNQVIHVNKKSHKYTSSSTKNIPIIQRFVIFAKKNLLNVKELFTN